MDPASTVENAKTQERHAQEIRGVVLSDKMAKTRVIEIKTTRRHKLYQKSMIRKHHLMIHDEKNESHVGDEVLAVSARPMSKNKNFKLRKILKKKVAE